MNQPLANTDALGGRWMNELEKRLLTSLRSLKQENHGLRSEVKRLQDCSGPAHGRGNIFSASSIELETQLQTKQLITREISQEVQWLLKHSQEILELRQQELQRLRGEMDAANSRLQKCQQQFLRSRDFDRTRVKVSCVFPLAERQRLS